MAHEELVAKVKRENPFPWSQAIYPNGVVKIFDATGAEVPLFNLTEFAVTMTALISANRKEQPA